MADWVLYLDESGVCEKHDIPLKQGQQPVFSLAGLALPIDCWRDYDRRYLKLKYHYFENEISSSSKHGASWEFKGNRAIAPRNKDSDRIVSFVHSCLDLISEFKGNLFSCSFLKNPVRPTASSSIYTVGLQIIAESFDIFLRENDSYGIIIMDSRMAHVKPGQGLDYAVALSLLTYFFGNEKGRELKRITEAPLFADSGLTAGLQMADLIACLMFANTYKHRLAPNGANGETGYLDYRHVSRYWNELNNLEFKSSREYEGFVKYGFKVQDHSIHK